jgi:hypothetical protein
MLFLLHLKDVVQPIDLRLQQEVAPAHRLNLLVVFADLLLQDSGSKLNEKFGVSEEYS